MPKIEEIAALMLTIFCCFVFLAIVGALALLFSPFFIAKLIGFKK